MEDAYGHYRVVVGYNTSSVMMLTFDPKKGMNFTISYAEFTQLWRPGSTFWTTNWTLATSPENNVFTNLMKQHQIDTNLQRSNYEELMKQIEERRKELSQTRDETTFYARLFVIATIVLISTVILMVTYITTRKPKSPSPEPVLKSRDQLCAPET